MGVLRGDWGFLTGDLENSIIHYGIDGTILPQGRYSESFVFISLLEVCQEWESFLGGTWRTLRVPDLRHRWQGHPWYHGWPGLALRIISWKFQVVIFMFCEVITDLGVNGQPPYSTVQYSRRERREEAELRFVLRMRVSSWEGEVYSEHIEGF